jgi:hypothetical protein
MMNRNQIIKLMGFCVAFIFLAVGGCEVWATQMSAGDTVELRVEAVMAYPGHFKTVRVTMKNPVPINSFKLEISLGDRWELAKFRTVRFFQDSIRVPLDTCPDPDTVCTVDTCLYSGVDGCDTLHPDPDICPCLVYQHVPVRECFIDTVGSLISNFQTISCHGDTEVNGHPDFITVVGMAHLHQFIEPSGSFRLLFKFGVDVSCIPDADTLRKVLFMISPGAFSYFSDTMGTRLTFKYYPIGDLRAWPSVPGDVNNDSVVNVSDVVFLINKLYLVPPGPPPCIRETADADSNCMVNVSDVVWIINYLYLGGPPPKHGCTPAIKEE